MKLTIPELQWVVGEKRLWDINGGVVMICTEVIGSFKISNNGTKFDSINVACVPSDDSIPGHYTFKLEGWRTMEKISC